MKHIALRTALMSFSATLLLFVGTVPANAQYYLNVFKKNGAKVEYLVSDLDSVTFTASVTPVIKKDVSKISVRYIELYSSDREISPFDLNFNYDNRNRVISMTTDDGVIKLDYSVNGSIIVRTPHDTATYNLDTNGYVSAVTGLGQNDVSLTFERDGDYISAMNPMLVFSHENGVLTSMTQSGVGDIEMTYRFNYDTPAINFDLNWFAFMGYESCAPMWLGYCGKLSDKLLEDPSFTYSYSSRMISPPINHDAEGTYHYEEKYNHYTGNVSNMSVVNDKNGYPSRLTYSMEIEEYVFSYDYVFDIDTVFFDGPGTKGKEENYQLRPHSNVIRGTEKDESTGRIVGTNDIVYSFEYKQ